MTRNRRETVSQFGIGAMIALLGGNESSVEAYKAAIGKEIATLEIGNEADKYRSVGDYKDTPNCLRMRFTDGTGIEFFDDAQSCCEYRHMHTDDDLSSFVGDKLVSAEVRDGGSKEGEWGDVTESQFLVVQTDKASFTVVNYNEHNGYYGGFAIRVRPL